jgi:hypothetical protein
MDRLPRAGREVSVADTKHRLWPVADLRDYLLGLWRLERILVDGRMGQGGSMEGTALFAPSAGRLLYSEAGVMRFGSHVGNAGQSYLYDFPEPWRAAVTRHDGVPFVELDLRSGRTSVAHHCGGDVYRGIFGAAARGEWWVDWQVSGPRKDQRISTRYRRLS